jgi:hypothetical protein
MSASEEPNEYSVHVNSGRGWEVQILDPQGATVWSRPCSDEAEARTFASTVQQHIYWLSPAKFRDYYRLTPSA